MILALTANLPCTVDIQSDAAAPRIYCALEKPRPMGTAGLTQKRVVLSLLPEDPRRTQLERAQSAMIPAYQEAKLLLGSRVVDGHQITVVQVSTPPQNKPPYPVNLAFGEIWFLRSPALAVWCNSLASTTCLDYLARFVRSPTPALPAGKRMVDYYDSPGAVAGIYGPPYPLSPNKAKVGPFVPSR